MLFIAYCFYISAKFLIFTYFIMRISWMIFIALTISILEIAHFIDSMKQIDIDNFAYIKQLNINEKLINLQALSNTKFKHYLYHFFTLFAILLCIIMIIINISHKKSTFFTVKSVAFIAYITILFMDYGVNITGFLVIPWENVYVKYIKYDLMIQSLKNIQKKTYGNVSCNEITAIQLVNATINYIYDNFIISILRDVNMMIKKGEKIAFYSSTEQGPVGKTELIKIIGNFYRFTDNNKDVYYYGDDHFYNGTKVNKQTLDRIKCYINNDNPNIIEMDVYGSDFFNSSLLQDVIESI